MVTDNARENDKVTLLRNGATLLDDFGVRERRPRPKRLLGVILKRIPSLVALMS
jgi:hypothetical protein